MPEFRAPFAIALSVAFSLATAGCPTAPDVDEFEEEEEEREPYPCEGIPVVTHEVSAEELAEMLENKDFELINVHVPFVGEIPGTDVHIRYTEIDAIEEYLEYDLERKAFLYCQLGPMSEIAVDAMLERGYCQIWDLPVGMIGWQAAGYPLNQEPPT